MGNKTCENCKWCEGETRKAIQERPTHTNDGNRISYDIVRDGFCWRFPKHQTVYLDDFCGEYKPKKK